MARGRVDDAAPTADIVELACQYGRCEYRRVTALLQEAANRGAAPLQDFGWEDEIFQAPSDENDGLFRDEVERGVGNVFQKKLEWCTAVIN